MMSLRVLLGTEHRSFMMSQKTTQKVKINYIVRGVTTENSTK